jgi:hypothetical protein
MRVSIPLALSFVIAGCGDNGKADSPADARKPDAPPDAYVEPPLTLQNNEGGEIRLEWISQFNAMLGVAQTTARMGAYFYKSQTPATWPIPAFPGCVDARARDKWPLAQGTIVSLDVGGVKVIPKTGTPFDLIKNMTTPPTKDAFQRPHDLWWQKPSALAANDADMYLPPNQSYNIELAGSAEWPHQVLENVAFMPERWVPTSPTADAVAMLTADTDFTVTYTPVTSSNLPAGARVNTVIAFTGTPNVGPIVICQEEGTDGSMTVPAAMVNIIRTAGGTGGRYVRQQLTHQLFELTDGTPREESARKRVDVLTIYCYNSQWLPTP